MGGARGCKGVSEPFLGFFVYLFLYILNLLGENPSSAVHTKSRHADLSLWTEESSESGEVLRKVVSDVSLEIDKIEKDLEHICSTIDEVMQAECECCGLREECTQDYIERIKDSYSGKWVCGLCSEAVKEGQKGGPVDIEEAVSSHRNFCQEFNSSTRLNPKLSLTMAMKNIARRSHENREKKQYPTSKISRSSSCAPRIDITMK